MTGPVLQQPPLILIGAGGHAQVVLECVRLLGRQVLFATETSEGRFGDRIGGVEIRGPDEIIAQHNPREVELVLGVGSTVQSHQRQEIFQRWSNKQYIFASVIHPSAVVAEGVSFADGVQVMAGAVLQPNCHVGANSIVNTRASLDHDTKIGDHCHIAPGATLCGRVAVEDLAFVGAGATVIDGISIGSGSLVGAGAVVVHDVPAGAKVLGIPATQRR